MDGLWTGSGVRAAFLGITLLVGCDAAPSPAAEPTPEPTADSRLVGTFIGWDAVDDTHGIAVISVLNDSLKEVTAECVVTVNGGFGEGSGTMEPETLLPGETVHSQVAVELEGARGEITGEVAC